MKASKTVEQIGTSRKNRLDSDIQARGFFWTDGGTAAGAMGVSKTQRHSLWCSVMVSLNGRFSLYLSFLPKGLLE